MTSKATNPKDIVGTKKAPLSTVSANVMAEVGVAMLEGALKYGRHNYRSVGVRASVYYDATIRHLFAWFDAGEDIDPDSGMHHVTKAIASLMVLRDAMINDLCTDDRPPSNKAFYADLNAKAAALIEKYKDCHPQHYTINDTPTPSADRIIADLCRNTLPAAEHHCGLDGMPVTYSSVLEGIAAEGTYPGKVWRVSDFEGHCNHRWAEDNGNVTYCVICGVGSK